jgi:hypothetical protein
MSESEYPSLFEVRPSRSHRRGERALAVTGAVLLLALGANAVSYAATGSALLLGKANTAGTTTTVTNTGAGAALRLVTKSAATAPFTTNSKGLVGNLYAARAASADKLAGLTVAKIVATAKANVNAVTLNGSSKAAIVGSARAFGSVTASGTLLRSTAGVSVSNAAPGIYCIAATGFDNATSVMTVSPEYGQDLTTIGLGGIVTNAEVYLSGLSCSGGFEAVTYSTNEATGTVSLVNSPFSFIIG